MFCWKCGTELSDGASFCKKCGAAVHPDGGQHRPPSTSMPMIPPAAQGQQASGQFVQGQPASDQPMPGQFAQGQPVPGQTVPAAAPARKKTPFIIAGAAVALVAVVVICIFVFNPFKTGTDTTGTAASAGSSVTIEGTTLQAIARPTIASTVTDPSSGMAAAPALSQYRTAEETSSDSASSDSTSDGTSDSTSGDTSSQGTSQGGVSGDSSASGSGGTALENRYGTLTEIKPESGLGNVTNMEDFHLTDAQKALLEQNMFVIDPSYGDAEFYETYESNRYDMLPSFVTTDSIMHTYHLYFSHLQKNAEKQYLSTELLTLSQSMLQTSIDQWNTLSGTEWDAAAKRNVIFFSVACCLLDPSTEFPSSVATEVDDELSKIQDASAMGTCAVTGDTEDYSQYKPRGYYEGDDQLERYFRTMMWYGRINFTQTSEGLGDDLDRSALLITLALDGGSGGTVDSDWESIYTVTSFFAGASDDMSYYEYYPLFAYAYGEGATVDDLAGNTKSWDTYHGLTDQMPAPKISSVIVGDETQVTDDDIKGFRFMGQRFSIDESIFQQLVYDNVDDRTIPSALDLPAALGSAEAYGILDDAGETSYPKYTDQMQKVRTDLANSDDSIWSASLYSQWLYTLNPLLVSKGVGYPSFMQSSAWDRKNLQSYLGSYTELKHDTVLYSKQVAVEMGGGVEQNDDRGYVEPEPELYARLANLTQSTSDGLSRYGMLSSEDADNLQLLKDMATQLQTISEEELSDETPTDDEYEFIRTYGGQLEHFWETVNTEDGQGKPSRASEYPAAVVVDIATDAENGDVLEVATGRVSTIYVLVPMDGELRICSGAVFSYYEFTQPQSDRLTDSTWRTMLGITGSSNQSAALPTQPAWTETFQSAREN